MICIFTSPNSISYYLKNVPLTIYNPSWFLKIHGHLFYGLHHKPSMLHVLQFHSCCGWSIDKDNTFYSIHQNVTNQNITKLSLNNINNKQVPWPSVKHYLKLWISIHIHILEKNIVAFKGPNQFFFDKSSPNRWTNWKNNGVLE
jgi:hypothetical protein